MLLNISKKNISFSFAKKTIIGKKNYFFNFLLKNQQ